MRKEESNNLLYIQLYNIAVPSSFSPFSPLLFIGTTIAKKIARRTDDKNTNAENWNKTIAMFTMAFYYIYLSVTRRALDVFNCNPSIPSDGYMYTEFTSVACEGGLCKCDEPGTGTLIGCFKGI